MSVTINSNGVKYNDNTTQVTSRQTPVAFCTGQNWSGAIQDSYNVSSMSRVSAGVMQFNFTNALSTTNYATFASCKMGSVGSGDNVQGAGRLYYNNSNQNYCTVGFINSSASSFTDPDYICITIYA